MTHVIKRFFSIWRNSIRTKLLIILISLMLVISIIGFLSLNISFRIYETQLLQKAGEVASLYAAAIEQEAEKIEKLTFDLLANSQIQSTLNTVNSEELTYDRYQMINKITSLLLSQANSQPYILSVGLVLLDGTQYAYGRQVEYFHGEAQQELLTGAARMQGRLYWKSAYPNQRTLIACREIRSIRDMSKIASLIVRIDIDRLIRAAVATPPPQKMQMLVVSEGRLLMGSGFEGGEPGQVLPLKTLRGQYEIIQISGEKYLASSYGSHYTHWQYVNLTSYDQIMQTVSTMRIVMLCVLLLFLLVCITAGVRFTAGITKPLVQLGQRMKRVEVGDFALEPKDLTLPGNPDELDILRYSFAVMTERVHKLMRENYQKQLLVREAELMALQAQINPHFLYNTMSSIHWMAKRDGQADIAVMVKALSNLLRNSISTGEGLFTVEDELRYLNDYITIQRIRYGERLDFRLTVSDNVSHIPILKFTLQPIVENAIQYGLEKMIGVCVINVILKKVGGDLEIEVSDNGPGMSDEAIKSLTNGNLKTSGTGIGLKNINERIHITFGDEYGLSYYSGSGSGMTVLIRMPGE